MADLPNRRGQAYVVLAAAVIAAASEAPRVAAAAGALPDALRPFVWSDLLATYFTRGLGGGKIPYLDVFFEYPPVTGYLSGLFSVAMGGAFGYTLAWAAVVVLSATAIAYLLAREAGTRAALWGWVLAPQVLLLAGVGADLLPAALLLGAAVLVRRGRLTWAAAALAIGAAAKLFPAAAAPLLLVRAGPRRGVAAAVFVLVALVIALPALLASHSAVEGLLYYAAGYQAGGVAVWGLLSTALEGAGVPAATSLVFGLTTAGLIVTYVRSVLPRARAAADPAIGFALATIAVLLWARLYSPQFSLWVLPFTALLGLERKRSFRLLALSDVAVFFTASPLTLVRWETADGLPTLLLAVLAVAVVLRHVALIGLWRSIARVAQEPRAR